MRARIWGCRGSLAAPGPETVRYGGNTSCVEVRPSDGRLLVIDAGTGARNLGLALGRIPNGGVAAALLVATGCVGLGITAAQCIRHAFASNIDTLQPIGPWSRGASRLIYRLLIAWLHLLQPYARARGALKGLLSPPQAPSGSQPKAVRPTLADLWRSGLRLAGRSDSARYWSERWVAGETMLAVLTNRLMRSSICSDLEIDDGWHADRDIGIAIGRA